MKISISTDVDRDTSRPKTPTVKPNEDEMSLILRYLLRIEATLGDFAKWVEVALVRFQQYDEQAEWTASFRFVLDVPGLSKLEAECLAERGSLFGKEGPGATIGRIVAQIEQVLEHRAYGLSQSVFLLDHAVASIKERHF